MSLEEKIHQALDDFDSTSSDKILEIIRQIMPHFKSTMISDYLQGKIQKILDENDAIEKKKQCKALKPYFDWYLQGL